MTSTRDNKGALGALIVNRTARILQQIQSINIYRMLSLDYIAEISYQNSHTMTDFT